MALETTIYDPADYIKSTEDVVGFLQAELEQNEPPYWPGAIAIVARARGGFSRLADETALSAEMLERASHEGAVPDRGILLKVIEAYRVSHSPASRVA